MRGKEEKRRGGAGEERKSKEATRGG